MKIAFLDAATMGNVSFEPFECLGEFVRYESSTPEQARERVRDLDVLLINKVLVDKELIDSAPNLKLIFILALYLILPSMIHLIHRHYLHLSKVALI